MILDLHSAKMKHLEWRFKLSTFLMGRQTLTLEQVVSHEHCNLGQWIYAEGLGKYGHIQLMQDLEQTHKLLHQLIRHTVEMKNQQQDTEAERAYEQMQEVSDRIMEQLDELAILIKTPGLAKGVTV